MKTKSIRKLPHYCYLITNLINNKVYVGVTYKEINERFKEHIKQARKKYKNSIHYAIVKYGKDNFKIELLKRYSNYEKAYKAEIKYIKKYNSYECGYNETLGGDNGPLTIKYKRGTIINILNEYCSGKLIADIAKKYNISYYSVFDITRFKISSTHNIPKSLIKKVKGFKNNFKRKKRVTKPIIIKIYNDFIKKLTMEEIAFKHKISVNTVWNVLHKQTWKSLDVDINLEKQIKNIFINDNRTNIKSCDVINIMQDFVNGYNIKQLSEKYSASERSIKSILKRNTWGKIIIDPALEIKLSKLLNAKK